MLSYQHAFHAGNHADILKHMTLLFVLNSLNKKEKPYTYFDTHAASGLYDLLDNRSLKTGEAKNGIEKLFKLKDEISGSHQILCEYLSTIEAYISKGVYAGSPEIARSKVRMQDTLIFSELHPQEIENLRTNILKTPFSPNVTSSIQIHKRNGYEMLKALTPPKTKRGAVLIDPSYEEVQDYKDAADAICAVNKKFSNGIIMLWYPLLAHREEEIKAMLFQIEESARTVNPNVEIAKIELCVNTPESHKEMSLKEFENSEKNPPRLYGSGMLVINAPWHYKEEMELTVPLLEKLLKA